MRLSRVSAFSCGSLAVVTLSSVLFGCATAVAPPPAEQEPAKVSDKIIGVSVDPRIELMSIVFRLAGNSEYNEPGIPGYAADVDAAFAAFKDHKTVQMARRLRDECSIGYDAPMALAVHMTDISSLAERVPFDPRPEGLDERWTPESARAFVAALADFVRDAKFEAFLESHEPLYREATARFASLVDKADIAPWLDSYVGSRGDSRFEVIIGLLNGGSSYGAHIRLSDGSEEIYAIPGAWEADEKGLPVFGEGYLGNLVHEFTHTYANPLVDHHASELQTAGQRIFPFVENSMRNQAYPEWKIMMYESMVRAIGVRYTARHHGADAAQRENAYNMGRGFLWIRELVKLLEKYENNRNAYPTLDAFMPEVASFFTDFSGRVESEMEKLKVWPENTPEAYRPGKIEQLLRDVAKEAGGKVDLVGIDCEKPPCFVSWRVPMPAIGTSEGWLEPVKQIGDTTTWKRYFLNTRGVQGTTVDCKDGRTEDVIVTSMIPVEWDKQSVDGMLVFWNARVGELLGKWECLPAAPK